MNLIGDLLPSSPTICMPFMGPPVNRSSSVYHTAILRVSFSYPIFKKVLIVFRYLAYRTIEESLMIVHPSTAFELLSRESRAGRLIALYLIKEHFQEPLLLPHLSLPPSSRPSFGKMTFGTSGQPSGPSLWHDIVEEGSLGA